MVSRKDVCMATMEPWFVEFEGGIIATMCLPKGSTRDDAMENAREMLKLSSDFDTRRASMGRIVKAYKR